MMNTNGPGDPPGADATLAEWLTYRGLPPGTGLTQLIEHERTQARLAGVFDCLAEYATVRQELVDADGLWQSLMDLLTGVANALKGDPGPLRRHDVSDLPAVAVAVADRVG